MKKEVVEETTPIVESRINLLQVRLAEYVKTGEDCTEIVQEIINHYCEYTISEV